MQTPGQPGLDKETCVKKHTHMHECTLALYLCLVVCKKVTSTDMSRRPVKGLGLGELLRVCCGLSCVPLIDAQVLICSSCGGDLMWKKNLFADNQDEINRLAGPIQCS